MTTFRILLVVLFAGVVGYTAIVIGAHGFWSVSGLFRRYRRHGLAWAVQCRLHEPADAFWTLAGLAPPFLTRRKSPWVFWASSAVGQYSRRISFLQASQPKAI